MSATIDPTMSQEEYQAFLAASTSATGPTGPTGPFIPDTPIPPPTIRVSDLLTERDVLLRKEADDKSTLDSIGQLTIETVRPKLVAWAVAGFPNAYPVHSITITPPSACSDGVTRNLADYIVFCSGKSIAEQLTGIQAMLPDINVGFVSSPPTISIVVTTA